MMFSMCRDYILITFSPHIIKNNINKKFKTCVRKRKWFLADEYN